MDTNAPTLNDRFIFDIDELRELAEESVLRDGLKDFKNSCVIGAEPEEEVLRAQVEDAGSEDALYLAIDYDGDGNLRLECDCGRDDGKLCRHGVAALFSYSSRTGTPKELLSAEQAALEERMQSARAEVQAEPLEGEAGFGAWRAWSIGGVSHFPRRYQVHIRNLSKRANYCSCPDFAVNRLGTCKHIEAVLHKLRKGQEFTALKGQSAPLPYIYLDWEGEEAPGVRLHRADGGMTGELANLLNEYFDDSGGFRRRMPEDFQRLTELLGDHGGVDVGADALDYAKRLTEQLAHELRAERIRDRIRATGGRIPGVTARLYPYQMDGVAFLAANGRALLADDMGLGKTLQAIAAAIWMRENAGVERVLIICPASLKHQWAREIERFCDAPVQVIQGKAEERGVQYRRGAGFYIANYELILRDVSVINEILRTDLLILDEAQRIKNWRTKIASAVKMIPTRYAFVLSGTPLENRLEDLYSLMQVVDPHVLGPLWRYMVDFHVTDDKGKVLGYRNLSELRRRLSRVMLRRDRRLVRDQLPDRITQRIDVELTEQQWDLHGSAMMAAGNLANIAKRRPLTPSESNRLMAALQSARMACDAAGLVDKETQGSPKLDELENILDELCLQSGLKMVIFSQWAMMTEMVEQRVRAMGLGCLRLHGGVPTARRGELMDRFRDDDSIQVFISTDAGATGLNLQSASVLVNMDIPWNPAVLEQRNARIHRLGQKEKVQIILLIAAGAYEESVYYMVQGKQNLFDNVVDSEASEDVVGVSKKLLEVLVADLNTKEEGQSQTIPEIPGEEAPEEAAPEAEELMAADAPRERGAIPRNEMELPSAELQRRETLVRQTIVLLQQAFGARIERVLGSGGGLMAVLDRVSDEDELQAEGLSGEVAVALIDARTLRSLNRLGDASPLAATQPLFEATAQEKDEARLLKLAEEKLKAGELLIEQHCFSAAAELLCGAMLASVAQLAGRQEVPEPARVGVWLYGELLPKGLVDAAQASAVGCALALQQGGDELSEPLLRKLAEDAREMLHRAG